MCAEACRAPVMQFIVFLIVLLCFQVDLDWFTEPTAVVQLCRSKWPYVEVCRVISSYRTRKSAMYSPRTVDTFGWRTKESLGALSLRNDAIEAHFQVDCRVVLPSLADAYKAQRYSCKWRPLQWDVCRNKLPDESLKSNCNGKLAKKIASATNMRPFSDASLPENERALERGSQLWLYELKIKITAIYLRRLFVLYFLCRNISIF